MRKVRNNRELTIILPVYNEREIIEKVLFEWQKTVSKYCRHVFMICEDGSTDGTKKLLRILKGKYPIVLNQRNFRRGYGPAVIDGILSSQTPYILCIDSDGQCDPLDFKHFWKSKTKGIVRIGWRVDRKDILQRKIFSRLFGKLFHILFPTTIHDPSAPYVLFEKRIILPYIKDLRFMHEGFWWGFVGMCVKRGIPVVESVIHHKNRLSGLTNVYHLSKMPSIAVRNIIGLFMLRFSN